MSKEQKEQEKRELAAIKEAEKIRVKVFKKKTKFLDPSSNLSTRSKALLSLAELDTPEG